MKSHFRTLLLSILSVFLLAGCALAPPTPDAPPEIISTNPVIETIPVTPTAEPAITAVAPAAAAPGELPAAVEYNLGETTIEQSIFPEDSRFRHMPVRLNGIIAAPDGGPARLPEYGNGPYPVVLILHGNHPGCPIPQGDMVDRWPCSADVERPNYRGFEYLARELAGRGYVALSININAENTWGFGETYPGERLQQIVDDHLKALARANAGGENLFGVDLNGRVDLRRLAIFGHSRGGEGAYWLAQDSLMGTPESYEKLGYGPIAGMLLIASPVIQGGAEGARVPFATILPACDSDVTHQEGQIFYEITRLDPAQEQWASSVWLENANHNYFNETLNDEALARTGRPDCQTILAPEKQREFLVRYAADFLTRIFSQDAKALQAATGQMGLNAKSLAPAELYGLSARVSSLATRADRLPLFMPAAESELHTNLAGGEVVAEGVAAHFCEEGYYSPAMLPGSEPCKRVNIVIPGNPALAVVSWTESGQALRFKLPQGSGDLSGYAAVSLRAALDPLSKLNKAGDYQSFSIQLTDGAGKTATLRTRPDEPALVFPAGYTEEDSFFEGGLFSGRVPMTTIRAPLGDFSGVDLQDIRELALVFDQTPSGSLFISDVELAR